MNYRFLSIFVLCAPALLFGLASLAASVEYEPLSAGEPSIPLMLLLGCVIGVYALLLIWERYL